MGWRGRCQLRGRETPAGRVPSGAACLGGLGPQPPAGTRGGLAGKARAGLLPAGAPTPTRHPPQDRRQTQTRSHPGLKRLELNLSFSSQTLTEGPLHAEAPGPGAQTRPKVVPGSPPDRQALRLMPKARPLSGRGGAMGAEDRPEPRPPTPQGAKPAEAFFKPEILLPEELIQRHNV